MGQRPGQNVDIGLYFHKEGPVSQKRMLKNRFVAERFQKKQNIFESSTKVSFSPFLEEVTSPHYNFHRATAPLYVINQDPPLKGQLGPY